MMTEEVWRQVWSVAAQSVSSVRKQRKSGTPAMGVVSLSNLSENTTPDKLRDVSPRQFWINPVKVTMSVIFHSCLRNVLLFGQNLCSFIYPTCIYNNSGLCLCWTLETQQWMQLWAFFPRSSVPIQHIRWPQSWHKIYMSVSAGP